MGRLWRVGVGDMDKEEGKAWSREVTGGIVSMGDMGGGLEGREGIWDKILCKALGNEGEEEGNGSGRRDGREYSALEIASS